MKRLVLIALILIVAVPLFAQAPKRSEAFASDFQTVPVMANTTGVGGSFTSYVALFNPTSSAYAVTATLYDGNGVTHTAQINLAAGQLKTYTNFLSDVFNYSGGGAVTFQSPNSTGGTHNNRFVVNSEIRAGAGSHYSTPIPVLEFAGSSSRSFAPGVTVDSNNRTNVGCFDQSGAPNTVKVTVLDNTGTQTIGTTSLSLPANGWGQTGITSVVSGGYIQFDPGDSAVCYAVVVDNTTNDGRFISAAEYRP
jgi:hypothetical protein